MRNAKRCAICRELVQRRRRRLAARQQLGKFLLRHGRRWEKSTWTLQHFAWIKQQKFDFEPQRCVLADHLQAVQDATARVERLDKALAELAPKCARLWPIIRALQALRGIALVSAVALVSELGDLQRFGSARQLMSYLGLVPSEHSSGLTQRRGSITKSGNTHARRILVEAAHHAYRLPVVSRQLRERQAGLAPEVVRIAQKALTRLHRRTCSRKGNPRRKSSWPSPANWRASCGRLASRRSYSESELAVLTGSSSLFIIGFKVNE